MTPSPVLTSAALSSGVAINVSITKGPWTRASSMMKWCCWLAGLFYMTKTAMISLIRTLTPPARGCESRRKSESMHPQLIRTLGANRRWNWNIEPSSLDISDKGHRSEHRWRKVAPMVQSHSLNYTRNTHQTSSCVQIVHFGMRGNIVDDRIDMWWQSPLMVH